MTHGAPPLCAEASYRSTLASGSAVSVRARRLHGWRVDRVAVDQAVQQIQDMGLGRRASLQRQFDGGEHGLFVMLENQGQNLDHLVVAAWRLEHALLQSPEGGRQFGERRVIAQGPGLALNDRQISAASRKPLWRSSVRGSGQKRGDARTRSAPRRRRCALDTPAG